MVSDPFETGGGDVRIELEHQDGGEFAVRVLDVDGEEVAAFRSLGGVTTVPVPAGLHLLEVTTTGLWRAALS